MSDEGAPSGAHTVSRSGLLWTAGWCGLGVMTVELTVTRALAPWFGASHYTWTNVIGAVLLALAAGYWLGGRLADRDPRPQRLGAILGLGALLLVPTPFLVGPLSGMLLPDPAALPPQMATGHVIRGSLVVTLFLFCLPILLLGMTGPFVTRLLIDSGLDGGRAAGRTLAVSTGGSLLGTYLPAHVLVEQFGVRATILIAAGAVVIGTIPLFVGRHRVVAAAAALLVPTVLGLVAAGMPLRPALGAPFVADGPREVELLEEIESSYQHLRLARWEVPGPDGPREQLRLALDEGVLEFHSVRAEGDLLTGAYYDHYAVLPDLLPADRSLEVAVLGGGCGTIPALLRTGRGDRVAGITSVEIDPRVAELGPRFGWNPDGQRDRTVVDDARFYLRRVDREHDLLILDAYARQIALPHHLSSVSFFELVQSRLAEGGIFAMNLSVHDLEGELARAVTRTVKEVFANVQAVSVPGSWNVVLLATDDTAQDFRPRMAPEPFAGLTRSWLEGLISRVPSEGGLVLTDDRAPMERLARAAR